MSELSVGLSVLLVIAYGLSLVFSLKTHRELFASVGSEQPNEAPWPLGLALATLAGVTVLVALVSEVFVGSVEQAAKTFGMTPAFVGALLLMVYLTFAMTLYLLPPRGEPLLQPGAKR